MSNTTDEEDGGGRGDSVLDYMEVSGESHRSGFVPVVGKRLTSLASREDARSPGDSECRQLARSFFF